MGKKLTQQEYVEKLKKTSNLVVIEQYINSRTPILHRCVCGNEWKIEPERAARKGTVCRKCGIANRKYNTSTGKSSGAKKIITNEIHDSRITNGVVRLEDFKGLNVPIQYKCECGTTWYNKPHNMIYGNTPTCPDCHLNKLSTANIASHHDYLTDLERLNIGVVPLEQYRGRNKKILHECVCGYQYTTIPARVLQGNLCGACGIDKKRKNQNKNKKEVLYYLQVEDKFKVGICRVIGDDAARSVKRRYGKFKDYEILYATILDSVHKAHAIEQRILNENKHLLYIGDPVLPDGNTELFIRDVFVNITIDDYIKEVSCLL